MFSIPCSDVLDLELSAYAIVLSVNIVKTKSSNMSGDRVREEGTEAVEMEGSSLVVEKNDSDSGDKKERSSDIVFHVTY